MVVVSFNLLQKRTPPSPRLGTLFDARPEIHENEATGIRNILLARIDKNQAATKRARSAIAAAFKSFFLRTMSANFSMIAACSAFRCLVIVQKNSLFTTRSVLVLPVQACFVYKLFSATLVGVLSGLCVIFCGSAVLSTAIEREAQCPPERAQPQTREVHQIRLVHSTLSFCSSHLLLRQSEVSSLRFSGGASFTLSVFAGNSWQRPVPRIALHSDSTARTWRRDT